MKRNRVLFAAALLLALALSIALGGCSFLASTTTTNAQSTTTTVAGQTTPADQAIAAVTKSTSIATPQTVKSGTLLAGSDASFPPLESTKKGGYEGFDVDLCTAIAKKLGLTLEIVQKEYKDLPGGLNSNSYDIIMSALPITSDLSAKMDFSNAYLPGTLSITTQSGSPITGSAGLSGKVVGVQIGATAQTQLTKVSGIKQIKTYDRVLDAFADLTKGNIDAVVSDQPTGTYILEKWPKPLDQSKKGSLVNSGTIDTGIGYGYAVKKGNTSLLSAINAALAELRTDGIYKQICDKWGVTGN